MSVDDHGVESAPVVVLSFAGTGLATVRCLAKGKMKIHAALFPSTGSGLETSYCRHCRTVALGFSPDDEEALCGWLTEFARSMPQRPVVFPTSDATALALARHRVRLEDGCTFWQTSHDELHRIISKDRLYRLAEAIGVRVPPMLVAPDPDAVAAWCKETPPPYFVKPFYVSVPGCRMERKNHVFASAAELLRYARTTSLRNVVVQTMIDCGDGRVYDAYGLCDRRGDVVALGSHRRIRQYPPGTGATSYGEIPVSDASEVVSRIFRETRKLLAHLRYHGIFGVEWLCEKRTGALYLADFNARPFSSIGHLADCGLNLPLLAYRELLGEESPSAERCPPLEPRYWMDFNTDLRSFWISKRESEQSWGDFASSVLRCDSFAYFDVRDLGPWVRRSVDLLRTVAGHVTRRTAPARLFARG